MSGTHSGGVLTGTLPFVISISWESANGCEFQATTCPGPGTAARSGNVILPDTAQEKPQEGKVISTGAGARGDDGKLIKPDVKKGDRILYGKWSGTEVKVDGKDYLIMKESDIMGIIE